jgi:catechol 2,3-dioxygenase-like lactoylglutathione lyase family enzyme
LGIEKLDVERQSSRALRDMLSVRPFARLVCVAAVATSAALGACSLYAYALLAQERSAVVAPEGALVQRVWHLGRVTGDLHRIIEFYHDVLGLNLRGARSPIPFYSVAAINEFVNAPPNAEFRAAFMPIQGTSTATTPQDQIYLEAFEYRNIDRRQVVPSLSNPGVSSLRLLVRDLGKTVAAAKAAGISVVTAGGDAVNVPAPDDLAGVARAIMLRDPDGYPVELVEVSPAPATLAPAGSPVLGAHVSVVVDDLDTSLHFYRRLMGPDLRVGPAAAWQTHSGISRLRNIRDTAYRTAAIYLPGSAIVLELIEFRDIEQSPYLPVFQDIGHGHVAFIVRDIQATVERMKELRVTSISQAGTWTQINPTTRAIYTRDPDGFFLEILERR